MTVWDSGYTFVHMKQFLQVAGSVLIALSIVIANFNDSPLWLKVFPWYQIHSALERVINKGEPLTKNDKGFEELITLLIIENSDVKSMNIEEIIRETQKAYLTEGGLSVTVGFEIKDSDGNRKDIVVENIATKALDYFVRRPVLKLALTLLVLGFIAQLIGVVNWSINVGMRMKLDSALQLFWTKAKTIPYGTIAVQVTILVIAGIILKLFGISLP